MATLGRNMLQQTMNPLQMVQNAHMRLQQLQMQGVDMENHEEVKKIKQFIANYQYKRQQQINQHNQLAGVQPLDTNLQPTTNGLGADHTMAPPPVPPLSPSPPPNITITEAQRRALNASMAAFKYIQSGLPVPDHVQAAMRLGASPERQPAVQTRFEEDPNSLEHNPNSGIYPYNAYMTPAARFAEVISTNAASAKHRVLMPTIFPQGLDPQAIVAERTRFVEARIERRILELSAMASTLSETSLEPPVKDGRLRAPSNRASFPSPSAHAKLRASIELKSLQLRHKQKALRAQVAERIAHGTAIPTDRKEFRRLRKPAMRDARSTEAAERKQRLERERKAKQKHLDYLRVICSHGTALLTSNRNNLNKIQRLGKSISKFHQDTEREEQKRIERVSKERLRALKNDDEEAYLKLIDTAKDTRITHLLKQTDSYLDNLSQAVVAQQNEVGPVPPVQDIIDGPIDETTFGASKQEDPEDKGKIDYYRVAHSINERVSAQPKILIGGQLKDYQLKGLQWMVSLYNNRLNGILADEMGLGKTIQTISLIAFLYERKRERGPYLVIVPLSTLMNWTLEFAKWVPMLKVISYKGSPNARRELQNQLRGDFQVLLTTYEYIIKDRPVLCKYRWTHMIIDEGHRMKNTQSKLSQTLTQYYHSRYRLILTGTPLQNNLPELWALLNFALPKVFNSVQSFDEWFNTPFANTGGGDKIELNEEESLLVIRRLHKVLRPFLLRRLKKDVESDLPDKTERVVKVRMSALQQRLYWQMREYGMILSGTGKGAQIKGLQNVLMQYRKICQHPYLFDEVENAMNEHGLGHMDNLIRASGKVELCNRMLPKLFASGHRVLMFFQMTKVMDIMEDYLRHRGWQFLRLDGSTKPEERAELLAKFNAPGSIYDIFLLSTRAGGLGLNLQTADTVILYDSDWNPHADLQAQDRAHRIGQTKVVRIFRFVTEKSIEESMLARARNKLNIDEKVIQAGKFDNKSTAQERENMLRMLIEGDQEDADESSILNDDEVNEILARSEEEANLFFQIDKDNARLKEKRIAEGGWVSDLMTVEELPEIYRSDEAPRLAQEEVLVGRGHRRRNNVVYDENMTEQDFIRNIDGYYTDEEPGPNAPPPPPLSASKHSKKMAETDSDAEEMPKQRGRPRNGVSTKRKRPKADTPSLPDDDLEELEERPAPKRRKTGGSGNKPPIVIIPEDIRQRMREIMQTCQQTIQELRNDDGRQRCELFKEVPSRQLYPDYYKIIKKPIAISTIRKRVAGTYYKSMQVFKEDWHQMFENAMIYNHEGSHVYADAVEMKKAFDATYERLTHGLDFLPGLHDPPSGTAPSTASGSATVPSSAPLSTMGYPSYTDEPPTPLQGLQYAQVGGMVPTAYQPTPPRRTVKRKVVDSDDEDYQSGSD